MNAESLNARDIQVLKGIYGVQPKVPLSDGAGEVVAVAPGLMRVKVGESPSLSPLATVEGGH